jgi:hypothetical protein
MQTSFSPDGHGKHNTACLSSLQTHASNAQLWTMAQRLKTAHVAFLHDTSVPSKKLFELNAERQHRVV